VPSCGEAAVTLLERFGAETVFGIPGVHTLEIYRGLAASSLRHVTPRHEQGAAFMADGWARVTGAPGVCVLIGGPGLTNALTPIAQAYHDSIPMLVLSGAVAAAERGYGEIHDLPDQRALMASVTAFSHTVGDANELPAVFERAYDMFASQRPRPVHIGLPVDVLRMPAATATPAAQPPAAPSAAPPPAAAPPAVERRPPRPSADDLERAAELLAAADSPLILLGGGARDAGPQAIALAERLGAPIGLTINARGTVPDRHPLCLGSALSFAPVDDLLREADATLLVGAEFSSLELWGLDRPLELRGLVRVDIDAEQLDRRWPAEVALHGDAGATLHALGDVLADVPPARADRAPDAAARVAKARSALRPPDEIARFTPMLNAIDRALPSDRIIAGDSTQPVYAANHLLAVHEPRSWLMPIGYGCLGCALPMAIGAKLARPERPVVAIAGDGGVMFSVQELATAAEHELSLPIVVYDNRGFGEIRDAMAHAGIDRLGTDGTVHDLAAIATGFGCLTNQPQTLDELEGALRDALTADRPTVIVVGDAA
jgi:acetolactate synthase-1/2/3 large subunit